MNAVTYAVTMNEVATLSLSSPVLKISLALNGLMTLKGRYHVLGGLLSATSQVNPEDLKINELIARVESENIKEIIIATNPTIEGEITALYLARQLAGPTS